jgi:uncharacterized membrane protein YgdD (TMEM256/DUF423 family)
MKNSHFLFLAFISGFLAVALGAFGAHSLKPHLDIYQQEIWQKAVFYQFIHTLILVFAAFWNESRRSKVLTYASMAFIAGILCFSGSLYLLAVRYLLGIEGMKIGFITPIGGVFFLFGWGLMAREALKVQ